MKAVIMAGGKGTRLYPLTCHLPKPMVPLLDRPCMEYIIDLLKRHGINEIAVTLQYLPQVIMNHFGDGTEFGVHLSYFEETVPLGTAGSVKNAEEFLDETFLVISGDALTDFDLTQALDFHRERKAIGTLLLARVEVPLEYGVVMTREDGRIIRFLEKPCWSEVFSDTVNTGIYVLEPEILNFVRKGETFDFSKDLFPSILERDLPLYGYTAEGYWSDIGNLAQYRQSQFDMLNGLVKVDIKGEEVAPGVWFGEEVKVDRGVLLEGPAFIGDHTVIEAAAKIGPYAVIGRYNWLEQGASVEHSILWNHNYLGKSASLKGSTLCNGTCIGAGAAAEENTVIGENSWVGERALIKPNVKIWPDKTVGASTIQQTSLIWGKSANRSLFGAEGISGIANIEITPELVGKIALAYGSCLARGAKVSVSSDQHPYSQILKYAAISGLLAGGIDVNDLGDTIAPVARYDCRCSRSDGGIHIRKAVEDKKTVLQFFDREGLPIDKNMERKIENAFILEDFARPDTQNLGRLVQTAPGLDAYLAEVGSRINGDLVRNRRFKVICCCENSLTGLILQRLLESLHCRIISALSPDLALERLVVDNKADLGVKLGAGGQSLTLFTEQGSVLSEDELLILKTLVSLNQRLPVGIPVSAPSVVEKMTGQAGVPVVRTKTVSRSLLEVGKLSPLQVHYDGFYSLALIMEYLARENVTLHKVIEELPHYHMSTDTVFCPAEAKGRVMRKLMEEVKGEQLELIDGIKVLTEDAWALILPDSERALFKVVAQGSSRLKAARLAHLYKDKIAAYQQG